MQIIINSYYYKKDSINEDLKHVVRSWRNCSRWISHTSKIFTSSYTTPNFKYTQIHIIIGVYEKSKKNYDPAH